MSAPWPIASSLVIGRTVAIQCERDLVATVRPFAKFKAKSPMRASWEAVARDPRRGVEPMRMACASRSGKFPAPVDEFPARAKKFPAPPKKIRCPREQGICLKSLERLCQLKSEPRNRHRFRTTSLPNSLPAGNWAAFGTHRPRRLPGSRRIVAAFPLVLAVAAPHQCPPLLYATAGQSRAPMASRSSVCA